MSADREHEVDDRIADWVDGRLSDRDRERFVAELRVNAQLRADLEQYERTVAAVRAALQAPTRPVQLADRVLAAIAAGKARSSEPSRLLRWRPLLWSLGCAAALLLIVMLVDAWSAPREPEAKLTAQAEGAGRPPEPPAAPRSEATRGDADAPMKRGPGSDEVPPPAEAIRQHVADDAASKDESASGSASERRAGEQAPSAPAPPEQGDGAGGKARRLAGEAPVPGDAEAGEKSAGTREEHAEQDEPASPTPDASIVTPEPQLGQNQTGTAATAVVADPVPLIVVLGNAPAASDLFAARARKAPKSDSTTGASRSEAKNADDAARRFEEFFTAQVAEMTQPVVPAGRGGTSKRAPATRPAEVPDRAAATPKHVPATWVHVAGVALLRLDDRAENGADGGARAPTWIERDWLVEGSRQDIAALLGRLATFTGEAQLELRTGETTVVPTNERAPVVADGLDLGMPATAADRQRIVLRFRLQPR